MRSAEDAVRMSALHLNVGEQGCERVTVGAGDDAVDVHLPPHLLPAPQQAVHRGEGRVERGTDRANRWFFSIGSDE